MNKKILVLAISGLLASSAAMAEGTNWTGLKLGIGGGGQYAVAKDHVTSEFDYTGPNGSESYWTDDFSGYADSVNDIGKAGGFATIDMSLDYQMDKFVVGLIANYDISQKRKAKHETWGDSNYNNAEYDNDTTGWHGVDTEFSTGNAAALGLRFGGLINDSTLLYATAGYTNIQTKQKVSSSAEAGNDFSDDYGSHDQTSSRNAHKSGYFLGAGLQSKFTDNVSLKLEYRMSDYGTIKNNATNNSNASMWSYGNDTGIDWENSSASLSQKTDLRVHSVRAVVSYDF